MKSHAPLSVDHRAESLPRREPLRLAREKSSRFDALYSEQIGDLGPLRAYLAPCIACVPGATVGPLLRAMMAAGLGAHLSRSEQGAGYFALGQARVTGLPAFAVTVGGAAATGLLPALWCANVTRTPIVAITGEVATTIAGRGAVQDGTGRDGPSLTAVTRAVTCRSVLAWTPDEAWRELLLCLELATVLREPAHLSLPLDVQRALWKAP